MGEMLAPAFDVSNSPLTPHDWRITRLGEIAELASGGTPSKSRPEFWKGTIPWASPKDLKRPRLYDAEDHISEAGLEDGSRIVQPGTLFVVVRGMILAKDLPVAIAMVPMAFNQDMKVVIPGPEVDGEFLLYAFQQHKPSLLPEIGTSAHGTRRISTSAIASFRFPLPPLPEQRAIAHVLRTVQRAKEATEKVIAVTRQLKASLMRHLFTYGPVPVENADRVRLKDTEIGAMPAHWDVRKLSEVMVCLDSRRIPLKATDRAKRGGSIPYYGASGVIDFIDGFIYDEPILLLSEDGANLESRNLPIAYEVDGKCWVNNHAHVLSVKHGVQAFFCDYINSMDISDYLSGTTRPKLTQGFMQSIKLPFPPHAEQNRIEQILEAINMKLDKEDRLRNALSAVFHSLLSHLMTGKLRVRDLDPTDHSHDGTAA